MVRFMVRFLCPVIMHTCELLMTLVHFHRNARAGKLTRELSNPHEEVKSMQSVAELCIW